MKYYIFEICKLYSAIKVHWASREWFFLRPKCTAIVDHFTNHHVTKYPSYNWDSRSMLGLRWCRHPPSTKPYCKSVPSAHHCQQFPYPLGTSFDTWMISYVALHPSQILSWAILRSFVQIFIFCTANFLTRLWWQIVLRTIFTQCLPGVPECRQTIPKALKLFMWSHTAQAYATCCGYSSSELTYALHHAVSKNKELIASFLNVGSYRYLLLKLVRREVREIWNPNFQKWELSALRAIVSS